MPINVGNPLQFETLFPEGQVFMSCDLSINVNTTRYEIDGVWKKFAGASDLAVADNTQSYVFINEVNNVEILTSGWPLTGSHVRLARVFTTGSVICQIVDQRPFFTTLSSSADSVAHADTTGQTPNDHHSQSHDISGSDHVFPGGTLTFLRADGTFAVASGTLETQEEGSTLATDTKVIDFVGTGVTATADGNKVTVTIASSSFVSQYAVTQSQTGEIFTTTLTSSQRVANLSVTASLSGTYKVTYTYGWNHNSTTTDFEAQFQEDGTDMGEIHKQEPKDSFGSFAGTGTNQRHYIERQFLRVIGSGSHDYSLDISTSTAGDASSVWDFMIEFERVL